MAVTIITGYTPVIGIKYTVTTSGTTDWSGVTNSTYFYDFVDKLPHYKDSNGNILEVFSSSGSTNTATSFTGGTVSGATIFTNGLTATTISATTYYNLPQDVYVTGATYNNNNLFTYTNNTGGTFNTLFNIVSGLTINGVLSATTITGLTTNVNELRFNTGYTGGVSNEGVMFWDEPNGTVTLGMHGGVVSQQIGLDQYYYIKNQSGATIENGRVVRAAGTLGASGRILGEYMIADGSIQGKYTLGIATEDIINGNDGYVTEFGLVRGLNTTGSIYGETWVDGDILYVSPTFAGGLTKVRPTTPNLHIEMAIVVDTHATNGSIFVRPNRYPYLGDLQNVHVNGDPSGSLFMLSGTTWVASNTLNGSYTMTGLTVNGNTRVTGPTILTNGLTANSVNSTSILSTTISGTQTTFTDSLFLNRASATPQSWGFRVANNNSSGFGRLAFQDLTNGVELLSLVNNSYGGNLGIGVSNPTEKLHVSGNTLISGSLSTTTISAATYYNLPIVSATFTGGTVSGATSFINGLTANTISATTYYNLPAEIQFACSDETTPITSGTSKITFRMPYNMVVNEVRASLTTAQVSGNTFTVDINYSGVSILSTKITIDNNEKTSTTASILPVISTQNLMDDIEVSVDVDQVGSGTIAKGLKVLIKGYRL